ncbi:MAG: hypothetical protein ACK47B_22490 [Armatimonadota bacterium]
MTAAELGALRSALARRGLLPAQVAAALGAGVEPVSRWEVAARLKRWLAGRARRQS